MVTTKVSNVNWMKKKLYNEKMYFGIQSYCHWMKIYSDTI